MDGEGEKSDVISRKLFDVICEKTMPDLPKRIGIPANELHRLFNPE